MLRSRLNVWRGHIDRSPPRLGNFLTPEQAFDATDSVCDIGNYLQQPAGLHWYNDDASTCEPEPLEDNFSARQAYREHAGRFRFDVHLWATVDGSKPPIPQVAAKFRQMARFLESQAAIVEKEHRERRKFTVKRSRGAAGGAL